MSLPKNALPYTGTFKKRSHRMLERFQQMEIPYDFPKMPWIMAKRIVAKRISKKEGGIQTQDHPCSKVYDGFLACVRRYPETYQKRCRTEAGKCLACFQEHKDWKASPKFTYMPFLEHFRLFQEGTQSREEGIGRFLYNDPTPKTHGSGTVMSFSAESKGPGKGGIKTTSQGKESPKGSSAGTRREDSPES